MIQAGTNSLELTMSVMSLRCPECGKTLKIKDESFLGKKVRCPGCQQTVLLARPQKSEDDDEVEIELVDPLTPVPPSRVRPAESLPAGNSPVYVTPGSPPAPAPSTPLPPVNPGRRPVPPASSPVSGSVPGRGMFEGVDQEGSEPPAETSVDHLRRLIEQKKRRGRNNAVILVALLGIAGIVGAIVVPMMNKKIPVTVPGHAPVASTGGPAPVPMAVGAYTEEQLESRADLVNEFRPTNGKPIDLRMVPDGVNLLIHLRPSKLWSNEGLLPEFRGCLIDPVLPWIEAAIKARCRRKPEEIEEATFAIVLGPTGSVPQIATIVRLAAPAKPSDLIEEFRGEVIEDDGKTRLIKSSTEYFVISGLQTFAIGPVAALSEVQAALAKPNETIPDGILELVRQSDRERLFTILFELDDVRRNVEGMFTTMSHNAVHNVLDWFGESVATIGWSANLDGYFHSEFTFYPKGTRGGGNVLATSRVVRDEMKEQVPVMPTLLVAAARKMRPGTLGFNQIIGRFPAMMQAYAMETVATITPKTARLTTVLPAKAAANIALGALLTWDESTRTNFTASATFEVADTGPKLPDKIEDRLRIPIDCDVTMPLEVCFTYLFGEVKVDCFVDGIALKSSGITKNEVQKLALGKTPVFLAIQSILNRGDRKQTYPDIVLVLDDANKKVTITTKAEAAAKGMTTFDVRAMK